MKTVLPVLAEKILQIPDLYFNQNILKTWTTKIILLIYLQQTESKKKD
jgi:hypothetical protein